jgi:DNA replication and repair protein RecF
MIKFLDLHKINERFRSEIDSKIKQVLDSGWYLLGEQDKTFETTMSGPHRDRINFVLENKNFVQTASTGQCRLISLLLRVAQAVFYTRTTGLKPVLLMDDVLLELDPDKRQKLTALLPDYEQLFCTFLPGEPYERYMKDTTKIYKISNGEWYE